ncbi:MAG: hypothetical protein JSS82_18525 [Bacteroidetes bacterium]|nr:hypothetical protein [Bacteroidota bacterium]
MNLQQAHNTIAKLAAYKGITMQPFTSPLKEFLILPANQKDFEQMLRDMTDHNKPFDTAISPFSNNVTILLCPEMLDGSDRLNHCSIEYFLQVNNIDLEKL